VLFYEAYKWHSVYFWNSPHRNTEQPRTYETALLPSVRPSVCPISAPHAAAAGLQLWARLPGDIDRLLHGQRHVAAAAADAPQQLNSEHRLVFLLQLRSAIVDG